jgi:holin-like protein
MLNAITLLLVFQLVGEVISQVLGLPIPGPVVGMLLLFLALHVRSAMVERLRETAQNILQHLSLLFVPAGVGVMLHLRRPASASCCTCGAWNTSGSQLHWRLY